MALSLTLKAAEVLEHFQWKDGEVLEEYIKNNKEDLGEELADVLGLVFLMAHDFNIDIYQALDKKNIKNGVRYPIDKSKGSAAKYNKL